MRTTWHAFSKRDGGVRSGTQRLRTRARPSLFLTGTAQRDRKWTHPVQAIPKRGGRNPSGFWFTSSPGGTACPEKDNGAAIGPSWKGDPQQASRNHRGLVSLAFPEWAVFKA